MIPKKHSWLKRGGGLLPGLLIALGLAACGGGSGSAVEAQPASAGDATQTILGSRSSGGSSSTTTIKPVAQPQNTEGRLLASNCFQCHGTMGTGGFDSIRGKDAGEVLEFLTKNASRDIMAAHAQGYTPAQLKKIVSYLQQ